MAYHFYVNTPTDAVVHWPFDDAAGTSAAGLVEADPDSAGPVGTLGGGASWVTDGKVDAQGVHHGWASQQAPSWNATGAVQVGRTQTAWAYDRCGVCLVAWLSGLAAS